MTTEERKQMDRLARKERILDCAQAIVAQKGFDTMRIEDIAEASGYTKRSLYLYFKDKDELFYLLVIRAQETFLEILNRTFSSVAQQEAAILELGQAFFAFSMDHPDQYELLMRYERSSLPNIIPVDAEEACITCNLLSQRYGQIVIDSIDRDRGLGFIRSSLTSQQLMLILWGATAGVFQIINMRRTLLESYYGIDPDSLFSQFKEAMRSMLLAF